MGQVPHYLIIGDGRVARHIACYFDYLGLSYQTWARRTQGITELPMLIDNATHILLLISDRAILDFINTHLLTVNKILVHFSASLTTQQAYTAHPLMSFTPTLYSLECYKSIWFVTEQEGPAFEHLLPGVPNSHAAIPKVDKNLYHSLCVMSSNFTCLLWQKLFKTFSQKWQIPNAAVYPILQQVMQNLLHDQQSALTGPLMRNDIDTIEKNIQALEDDLYQDVYQAFVNAYQQEK